MPTKLLGNSNPGTVRVEGRTEGIKTEFFVQWEGITAHPTSHQNVF